MKPAQCASGPEPDAGQGTLLAGRYRLVERLGEQDGSAEWRATDEMLARTVAVRVFTRESRHVARVMSGRSCRVPGQRSAAGSDFRCR